MPLPRACLALLLVLLVSCFDHNDNFSQHPGFAEWYAAHPPSEALPGADDRALLARYQPRIFLSAGANGPIDFYRDYIAHGRLYDGAGRLISAEVTREILNRHKHDPHVEFEHEASGAPVHRVIYGRIDRDQLRLPGCEHPLPVTFLTYNLVFRSSGVPAGLPGWQNVLLGLFADLDDWHQLDHYTALTLALWQSAKGALAPFAVTFQQHNYLRTYLLGDADRPGHLALPPDGRLAVDVALRSNELYPHRQGRTRRRAVSFLTPDSARYLMSGEHRPWMTADDITDPAREITAELAFLPPADAFYVFEGWLGARRWLPGRSGPPGADYNTLPVFKPKPVQLTVFYWREDDAAYLKLLANLFADGRPAEVPLSPFAARFAADLPRADLSAACGMPTRAG